MFSDENSVKISGRIMSQPEFKQTRTGNWMASWSIANNYVEEDEDGRQHSDTSFVYVVAWGDTARLLKQGRPILEKGDYISIEGRLSVKSVEGKDGNRRVYTQVVLKDVPAKRDRKGDKRYSGAGTAGAKGGAHYSQATVSDRFTGDDNDEVDGTNRPTLGDMARLERRFATTG